LVCATLSYFFPTFVLCMIVAIVGLAFAEWERRHPERPPQK
jgi:hypothetical protein